MNASGGGWPRGGAPRPAGGGGLGPPARGGPGGAGGRPPPGGGGGGPPGGGPPPGAPPPRPSLLLCDEPTGNLDTSNTAAILDLFDELRADGLTIVVITHDASVSARSDHRARIVDGTLFSEDDVREGAEAQLWRG